MLRRLSLPLFALAGLFALLIVPDAGVTAASSLQTPEQFIGFRVGTDNKLAHWDKIVEYMKHAGATSDRVRYRELGRTLRGNPLIVLEISSPDTLKNLDRYKQLERRLYFQNGAPSPRERDEIFRQGKVVVLVTCSIHATEVGATQMALELVHQLATDDSPAVKKVLDNVILLLVPNLNPDGQVMVAEWFEKNLGTPYESSPMPYLYHPYAGHDNNRDMYVFTQKESQYMAQLVWHDWFPTIWADEHQMGSNGARIFVMPATDPINPNVHPLIYRWNAILGQSQAAALEAAGKDGIIHSSTYTNYWQGAMAWSGWWHNQIGLLTEVASARIAAPVEQVRASQRSNAPAARARRDDVEPAASGHLPAPTDTTPRTEYPRPWMGGRWTLRDIVDYEQIATMALLDAAADRREAILRQIYEVNRQTIDEGRAGSLKAIVVPVERQQDRREAAHLVDRLSMAGVEVYRSEAPFTADGTSYEAGTLVIPMTQVFARYAKDILEKQKYPEGRRQQGDLEEPPYDVTAWSLGMLFGVNVDFIGSALPASLRMTRVQGFMRTAGRVSGNGPVYAFDYTGPDSAIAANRLLKEGARLAFESPSRFVVEGVGRERLEPLAKELGIVALSVDLPVSTGSDTRVPLVRAPRIGVYASWTGANPDEGWTRWVLDQYEFVHSTIHNGDIREGGLRRRFDAIILPDQNPREIIAGYNGPSIRPEYRGGIGEAGVQNLARFVAEGGTLIALGAASDLAIDRQPLPVRNLKRGLRSEEHYAPGTILRIQVDQSNPLGFGMAADTYGFYNNGPFFSLLEGFGSLKPRVIARYPNQDVVASGWLRGEELMSGRAAVVAVDLNPGRVVLFGLRPQHRAQTHATFPLLFNSLFLSVAPGGLSPTDQ